MSNAVETLTPNKSKCPECGVPSRFLYGQKRQRSSGGWDRMGEPYLCGDCTRAAGGETVAEFLERLNREREARP